MFYSIASNIYNIITQQIGALIGLLGVGLSIYSSWKLNQQSITFQKEVINHNKVYDQWRNKYNTLVQLIASRNDVGTYDFMAALNGVPATYFDSPEVLKK